MAMALRELAEKLPAQAPWPGQAGSFVLERYGAQEVSPFSG